MSHICRKFEYRCQNALMHSCGHISAGVWIVVLGKCLWIWTERADTGQAATRGRTGKDRLFVLMRSTAAKTHILLSQPWPCLSVYSCNIEPGVRDHANIRRFISQSSPPPSKRIHVFVEYLQFVSRCETLCTMGSMTESKAWPLTPEEVYGAQGSRVGRDDHSGTSQHSWRFAPAAAECFPSLYICPHLSAQLQLLFSEA